MNRRLEWKAKKDISGSWIVGHQLRPRQQERGPPAMKRSRDRRGIAGFIIRRFPEHFASGLFERCNAETSFATDDHQDCVSFDEGRARGTEESFWSMKLPFCVYGP